MRNLVLLQDLRVLTPERVEQLGWTIDAEAPHGLIDSHAEIPEKLILDYGLGLRLFGRSEWMDADQLKAMDWRTEEGGEITASWAAPSGQTHVWRIDPKLGFALLEYSVMNANGGIVAEHRMSGFEEVDDVMLPTTIIQRTLFMDGGVQRVSRTIRIDVSDYIVDDPENIPELYRITWPAGTHVRDQRTGIYFVVEPGEPRSVGDGDVQRVLVHNGVQPEVVQVSIVNSQRVRGGGVRYAIIGSAVFAAVLLPATIAWRGGFRVGRR